MVNAMRLLENPHAKFQVANSPDPSVCFLPKDRNLGNKIECPGISFLCHFHQFIFISTLGSIRCPQNKTYLDNKRVHYAFTWREPMFEFLLQGKQKDSLSIVIKGIEESVTNLTRKKERACKEKTDVVL